MNAQDLKDIVYDHYPFNIDLDDPRFINNPLTKTLINKCRQAYKQRDNWLNFLDSIKKLNIKVADYSFKLQSGLNPSLIAYIISESTNPYWLTLKISVIAPVYCLYYDNRSFDFNNRFIRFNPITEYEKEIFITIQNSLLKYYKNYDNLDLSDCYYLLNNLGNIRTFRRKPFLDECLFGAFMSIHP